MAKEKPMAGKCPKCDETLTQVAVERVDLLTDGKLEWRGVSYFCPHCQAILSVGFDPLSLNADLLLDLEDVLNPQGD